MFYLGIFFVGIDQTLCKVWTRDTMPQQFPPSIFLNLIVTKLESSIRNTFSLKFRLKPSEPVLYIISKSHAFHAT